MPRIQVSKTVARPAREVYEALKGYFNQSGPLDALGSEKLEMVWDDQALKGAFTHGKVDGEVTVSNETPCALNIEINLPFVLSPLAGLVQKTIQKHLENIT